MEDKTKIIIFERKEIFLVFLFLVLSSVLSFTLGVRLGISRSYESAGITGSDMRQVELKSEVEESLEDIMAQKQEMKMQEGAKGNDEEKKEVEDKALLKLREEFHRLNLDKKNNESVKAKETTKNTEAAEESLLTDVSSYRGRLTVQVGSYEEIKDALRFAEGFKVRGMSPIVYKVERGNQKIWYRVGVGVFETYEEAKNFIIEEDSVFSGQDYVISEILN